MSDSAGWVVRDFGPDRPGRYLSEDGSFGPLASATWFDTRDAAESAAQRCDVPCVPRQMVGGPAR